MNELLRRLLGGGYMDEANDGTTGGPGGGEAVVDAPATGEGAGAPAGGAPAAPAEPIENGMLAAIKEKIAPLGADGEVTRADDGKGNLSEAAKTLRAARKGAEKGAPAAGAEPDPKGPQPDPKKKPDAAKPKTAADYDLPADMKKALSPQANQRIRELVDYSKEQETKVAAAAQQVTKLQEANAQVLTLFEEHHVTPDDLAALLSHHKMVRSGNLEGALKSIETQRTAILRALGREAPGFDPLDDFPDLKARVDGQEILRKDAIALANARRREHASAAAVGRARAHADAQGNVKARQDAALTSIDAWAAQISQSDIDYAAKEARLLPQLKEITAKYPPELWLPTFQRIYDAMVVQASSGESPGNMQPLRPNGARGGARQPGDMTEAIRQGLGYQA